MAKRITVDERRCLACKACVLQCALAHGSAASLVEALEGGSPLRPRVHVEAVGEYGMPMQCRHCTDAPCMAVCPVEAVARTGQDGPVLLDEDRCIGCGLCVLVCPFGVIDLSPTGKGVIKCDLCIERTAVGEPPACVAACHTGALKFEEIEAWLSRRRKQAAETLQAAAAADSAGSNDGPDQG